MAGPGRLLCFLVAAVCLAGAILAAEQEVQDFDFVDMGEPQVVVKRAAQGSGPTNTAWDDEDFLADDPGSGPDEEYNGSGEPPPGFASRTYRIMVTVPGLPFDRALTDRRTAQFQREAQLMSRALQRAMNLELDEFQVNVVDFEPSPSRGTIVTVDMIVEGSETEREVEDVWRRLVAGRLPSPEYRMSDEGFSFRLLDGARQCPQYVGREPTPLPRTGDNRASIMVNNMFMCAGTITAWQYYRVIPQGTAYVGVFSQGADSTFTLVRKTELPPTNVGSVEVELREPIPVARGDIVGVFYPRSAPGNVIAMAMPEDNAVGGDQLFQTFRAQLYDEDMREGYPFNIDRYSVEPADATYGLRAVMEYEDAGVVSPDACADDEFSCGDGYCIKADYTCDGQNDCNNNADEMRCTACKSDAFLCGDGQCIPDISVCDGRRDCTDNRDEANCAPTRCERDEFQCGSGECVPASRRCDRAVDCGDASDESNCPRVDCASNQFQCDDGRCIDISLRCDSRPDCPNSEDEIRCSSCNPNTEFACRDRTQCIPLDRKCNSVPDCQDFSDEHPDECSAVIPTDPPPCPGDSFRCASGICIDVRRRCDRTPDCLDGSDELDCEDLSCRADQFRCADGACIDANMECDGFADCQDFSDEGEQCPQPCGDDEFTCDNRRCVDVRRRCDGSNDCGDNSDERGCSCRDDEFDCGDFNCIQRAYVCDGSRDCSDGSDEANCARCRRTEFECADGSCVDARSRCDRYGNCPDSSDEFFCNCTAAEFRCLTNGQCVPQSAFCDQRRDCVDGSDESDCQTCRDDQFTCGDLSCIDRRRLCDGRDDCRDRSDEANCAPRTCAFGEFTCSNGQCIADSQRCDRQRDCQDGSDEEACPCRDREFTCVSDGICLPESYRCNGRSDCRDGSDEADCTVQCSDREFTCSNGQCVPESSRCNGRPDCSDRSDEARCPSPVSSISISPEQMRKRVGTSASFVCMVEGRMRDPRIRWTRRTGGAMPPQAQISGDRLTIVNLRPEDSGDYQCSVSTPQGPMTANARLGVEFVGPTIVDPGPTGRCGRDQTTCANGRCIPKDYVCDGEVDCSDSSDESGCNLDLPCEPNEFRCDNGRCAVKIWRCDGDDDCLDGSDERECPTREPGAQCRSDEFTCRTNDQCIPASYQCDDEPDCLDRSDEIGCVRPSIITPPVPEIIVEVNGTFSIICEATGVPVPLIVWRLNWGNIPTGPRVTVTSYQGRGVLTVRNAVLEDAGAYTCEAINNRGSIFAVPDALIIVRVSQGVCDDSTFNAEALTTSDCIRCFCFGHTTRCVSSNLQISQITLGNQVALVRRNTLEPTEEGLIQYIPGPSRQFQVTDFNTVLRTGSYYWSLPYQYLSKRIQSYGGELTYQVYYEVDGFDVPTNDPDIIITGNGITLYHRSETNFRPRVPTTVRVNLNENEWYRSPDTRRGGSISDYASREDMMIALENVTSILIRATYDNRQSLIRLGNVLLTTGGLQDVGLGRAVSVEECTCPTGYTGFSCEECAAGFYRVERGRYGRECVACNCNGHSNECDPLSGVCRNCRDNTVGRFCDQCAPGFVGDARSGRRDGCQPCPCPLTNPENQFSRTCIRDTDGDITCTACPAGYEGRRCERCADGYSGNPSVRGERCSLKSDDDRCDNRGSLSSFTDPITRQCRCKGNVEGRYCNECRQDTFYLSENFPDGCISCFCMGVTQTCQSTTYNRAQVSLSFRSNNPEGVTLSDMRREQSVSEGFTVDRGSREIVFRNFRNIDRSIHYWSLPSQFLGDKVTAYGGSLRFTLRYRPGFDNSPLPLIDPLVEIVGNDITLVYRTTQQPEPGRQVSFNVPMIESQWLRMDGEPATREHMLMTLADLDFIHIRAAFTGETEESALSGISLDIAEDRNTGQERAFAVEECICPRGYKGLSCEDCDTGYTRTGGGLYLGLCEPCNCNGHSSECDPETGVCRNCRHNTEGGRCDRCARGFYGDATRGSPNDCQRCPCPLTESPNQFSTDCILDVDNQVTCTACPPGHSGRRCERCDPGYMGNPLQPGDYCKPMNETCDCDGRGTLPNTQCDPNSQQCQCRQNVQGRRCSRCREGYFNLDSQNEAGCLKCFCMDISNQCSSSNYYRAEVTPILNSDGTHNFQLNNRLLTRPISDGFTMDAERNEITFSNFNGIQRERESLYFELPPKFRGNKVSSYNGYLRFEVSYTTAQDIGEEYMDVDVQITSGQKRIYHLFRPLPDAGRSTSYNIQLNEDNFRNLMSPDPLTREMFMTILADADAILIRATYSSAMTSATLRNLRMEIAVPTATGLSGAPEVESCACPEGYTGLSCEQCAPGYLRVEDPSTALGRCTRCNCNGHASSCDPVTGECRDCQHNTVGDRCDRCARGYYGDATGGTPNDCRVCPCPLTLPSNQFSPSCFLDRDNIVTCDRCPTGYTGRDCGQCAQDYVGNPRTPGGRCERDVGPIPQVIVNPVELTESLGSTASFQCRPEGRGPFSVVWSRLDRRSLPPRVTQGPGPNYLLTINNLEYSDAARYMCTVTNAYGTNREYVTLSVEAPDRPVRIRIEEPTTWDGRLGETAQFICVAVQYSTPANYVLSWSKDGGVMPSKAVDQGGQLVIPNVQESDLGTYTCTGSDPTSQDTARAVIRFGSNADPPTVRIEPRFVRATEGDRVEFRCIARGSPTPTVVWTKGRDQGPLPSYAYTDDNGVLRIESVTMQDQSDYYCTATNSEGTSSVRTIIYVRSTDRVRIFVRETSVNATIGQSVRLQCYADGGNGDISLIWSRDRSSLPMGATQENGVLTLTNVQPSYGGNYYCTGTGPSGNLGRATAVVNIIGTVYARPTVRMDPERQTVGTGQTATVRCVVTGDPIPEIVWSRARGELSSNHQVNGNILRIAQTTMEDRGLYVCTASNAAGSARGSAIVDVERRDPPRIDLYPDSQQTIRVGASVLFQCRIMGGTPRPEIVWTRAGGRPFTERTEIKIENGVLMITGATSEEQGEYLCSATNDLGTVTATASLRVEGPPSITITPGTQVTTLVGETVNIECVGVGDPTPNVFWKSEKRRRSDVLPESFASGPGAAQLKFQRVRERDAGRYICVAVNERGTTEEIVDLQVRDRSTTLTPSVNIQGPQQLSFVTGQEVTLTCASEGLENPRVRWRRPGGQPLPPGHRVQNGVLYIPRIESEYSGEYICTVVSQGQPRSEFTASVYIIVTVRPQVVISPSRVSTRVGQSVRLSCSTNSPGPVNIEWQRVGGTLSPTANENNGVLEIRQVSRADSGRYRCIISGQGGVTDEGYADLTVFAAPTVSVSPTRNAAYQGSLVEIRCEVTGDPQPQIRWDKDAGELPPQHSVRDGVLTLYNVQPEDTGRYICSATNDQATVRATSFLTVLDQTGGVVPRPSLRRVRVGEEVSLECVVTGQDLPTATWTKVGGQLPQSAVIGQNILIIKNIQMEDSGVYRCTAINQAGSVTSEIEIRVSERDGVPVVPSVRPQQDYTTAALGAPAQLRCDVQDGRDPRVSWIKETGDLPDEHSIIEGGDLYIPRVREEDEGRYECVTRNAIGSARFPVILNVEALVPYFTQNPTSYMTFKPLNDVYLDLDILLSFRPEATDGLLLYNGQFNDGTGDYVCFGMQGQYPEFRFDVGAGPAIVRGSRPLELNRWHTVHLKRDAKNGTMLVNDEPPVNGTAPGSYEGLDIAQPMYVGSVPDFSVVPRSARFTRGYVGGLSEIKIKGVSMNLGAEALDIQGVDQYQVCRSRPCENGGLCRPFNTKLGFICECPRGYAGDRCQMVGGRCYAGACGSTGRCYNHPDSYGFSCICPLGRTGEQCAQSMRIVDPAFNKTSFISYPTLTSGLLSVDLRLTFKPRSLDNGIVLYNAQDRDGVQDFIAIIIKDRYLEFRFDIGSGTARLRSRQPLRVDQWTQVVVTRRGREGTLTLNDEEPVTDQINSRDDDFFPSLARGDLGRGSSADTGSVGLNLDRPLYLGGVDPYEVVNREVGVGSGFVGCIGELMVGRQMIPLIDSAIESLNVQDCGDRSMCERRPCRNGGRCIDLSPSEYMCDCPAQFVGQNCETEMNICNTNPPCQNGGRCVMEGESHRCDCPLNFAGENCDERVTLDTAVEFRGNGYAEFPFDVFPHSPRSNTERIVIEFSTTERDGLLFWQGQPGGADPSADYFSVALAEGYVEFRYELGSGPALIRSVQPVDDGFSHTVEITRNGIEGTLKVDGRQQMSGVSKGSLAILNAKGPVFIGGVPDFDQHTAGLYNAYFQGCITRLSIGPREVTVGLDAVAGMNVRPCV